jgi:hypothetical protein
VNGWRPNSRHLLRCMSQELARTSHLIPLSVCSRGVCRRSHYLGSQGQVTSRREMAEEATILELQYVAFQS